MLVIITENPGKTCQEFNCITKACSQLEKKMFNQVMKINNKTNNMHMQFFKMISISLINKKYSSSLLKREFNCLNKEAELGRIWDCKGY